MENRNKGRVVVFMSLIISVLLVLLTVVFQVVIQSAAKSKTVIASQLSGSDIKACYNNYIFEHYHILLFDKTMGGKGEAYVETLLQTYYEDKLGAEYTDKNVEITEFHMLTDKDGAPFQEQMQAYITYALAQQAAQAAVDEIKTKTDGHDGTLPADLEQDMDEAEKQSENPGDTEEQNEQETEHQPDGASDAEENAEDPRDYTKKLSSSAILNLVLPDDKTVSGAVASLSELPSHAQSGKQDDYEEVERDFGSMKAMKKGLKTLGSWQDALVDTGAQAAYIPLVFNSFMEQKNDTSVLQYEQEYLIAGKASDQENLKSVAHRMIGLRYPMNYVSLCAQADKMAELHSLAASLSAAAPYLIPVVKYLLAGCWAYVESIADVKVLFDGKKAAAVKTSENWITDLSHIRESLSKDTKEVKNGLDYQAYLTILQLMKTDRTRNRMLDLIQINTRQKQDAFRIRNAAVGFEADFESSFQNRGFYYHQSVEY